MGSEVNTRFKLSIWRAAQIGRNLDYPHRGEKTRAAPQTTFDRNRLQEEIYFWHPGQEDVWGCIENSGLASELRDLFVEGFAPNLSPEDRSMAKFEDAVKRFREILATPKASSWGDAIQMVQIRRAEPTNLRANSALSLLLHMEWILRTFGSVPGASVAIR
jgi:hypothetical protein